MLKSVANSNVNNKRGGSMPQIVGHLRHRLRQAVLFIKGIFMSFYLLPLSEILKSKKSVHEVPIVYFLISTNEVVYVGKSLKGYARISEHLQKGIKIFDSYYYIHAKRSEIGQLEKEYIRYFQPKYNVALNIKEKKPFCKFIDQDGKKVFRTNYRIKNANAGINYGFC